MTITDEKKVEANAFYKEALELLQESGADFMLGGAFATFHYTGVFRETKDIDIFCKSSEYPKILKHFASKGFKTELTDIRWLAKVFKGEYFMDVIFDSVNHICTVDDSWYEHAVEADFMGLRVKMIPPEELIWCKTYVQNRERFDGADVNHMFLKYGKNLNWERLMMRLDHHWQLLLAKILVFQFVYPADYRDIIPQWLWDELIKRANEQYELPPAQEKVCRGPIIDNTQYSIDIRDWNYKSVTIKSV